MRHPPLCQTSSASKPCAAPWLAARTGLDDIRMLMIAAVVNCFMSFSPT